MRPPRWSGGQERRRRLQFQMHQPIPTVPAVPPPPAPAAMPPAAAPLQPPAATPAAVAPAPIAPMSAQAVPAQPRAGVASWRLFVRLWQMLWQVLGKAFQPFQRRRVPVLIQLTEVECGAACLAMLLSYYGRPTTVAEVRERCGVGRDGLSALDIVKAARGYGMRVRAVSLQENDFRSVTLPTIIHWQFNHYLIVERWAPQQVDLVDPAIGRRRVTGKEFDQSFTGVVVMLEPGAQFDRTGKARQVSLWSYALRYVKLAPYALVQVLAASLVLQLFGLVVPVLTAVVVDQIIPLGLTNTLTFLALGLVYSGPGAIGDNDLTCYCAALSPDQSGYPEYAQLY